MINKESVKSTGREESVVGGRDSFYSSISMKQDNIAKNNTCKIKDMIYNCGEYETGEESQKLNQNYRRNTVDYPDHFKDPKADPLSLPSTDYTAQLR